MSDVQDRTGTSDAPEEGSVLEALEKDRAIPHDERERRFFALLQQRSEEVAGLEAEENRKQAQTRARLLSGAIDDIDDPGTEALKDPSTRRAIREASGLTLRELAAVLGFPEQTVKHLEVAPRFDPDDFLLAPRYRKALGVLAVVAAEEAGQ